MALDCIRKMAFLVCLPSIIKRSEKAACILHKKEELGRVQTLIIHSSFLYVLLKDRCKSQNQRTGTLSGEIPSASRRRNQSLMNNDDWNHTCGDNWDKDGDMKVMGQVRKLSH